MNDLYQSNYQTGIYSPIYLPAIIFYDQEESEHETGVDEIAQA